MSITRLSGGLTPADGGDPRTFPTIWNATADSIESLQVSTAANGSAILSLSPQVAANGSAISVIEAWNIEDLNNVEIIGPAEGQLLAYSTALPGWVNSSASGGGGGLVLIDRVAVSAVSTLTFNNVFTTDYENYMLLSNFTGSASAALSLRFRAGGTDDSTNNYHLQLISAQATSITTIKRTETSLFYSGNYSGTRQMARMIVGRPAFAERTNGLLEANQDAGSTTFYRPGGFDVATTTAYDGFTLFPGSGTMTGEIAIYGFEV
jgi:hypothetical protein